ncbi:MAG: tyrosine-protein phosphatase [Pseudomonadota bacterium]
MAEKEDQEEAAAPAQRPAVDPPPVLRPDSLPISYPARPDPLLAEHPITYTDPAHQARHEQRLRRIRRWRRPLDRGRDRLRAWLNMLFVDHGILRLFYPNRWQVTDRMWRSSQPLPHHLRSFFRKGGRAVVSLRGGQTFGSLPLEIEACMAAEVPFHTIILRSRDLPERDELLEIIDVLPKLQTPVLFHCKSGADRAGFMAALWLLVIEERPLAEAQRQLSLRFGHIRQAKTGVLDAFFDAFGAAGGHAGLSFRDWVATEYDPGAIKAAFKPTTLASLIGDGILRRE